jgi:hypothetical protein
MSETKPILLDPVRRILRIDASLSAAVISGTDKVRSGFGSGDCVLLDFSRKIFAVADATERHPDASRRLLDRLHRGIVERGLPDDADAWRAVINAAYAEQPYMYKTTFCCVALYDRGGYSEAIIANGGDSMAMLFDGESGAALYQTKSDMYFAGRSKEISTVETLRLDERHARLLVATDGFTDVLKHYTDGISIKTVPGEYLTYPVDRMCRKLYSDLENLGSAIEHDDIGIILLNPIGLAVRDRRIIMGGTTAPEEVRIRSERKMIEGGEWLPDGEWKSHEAELAASGIYV